MKIKKGNKYFADCDVLSWAVFLAVTFVCIASCNNDEKVAPNHDPNGTDITGLAENMRKIGFRADKVVKVDEGYLVDDDVVVTEELIEGFVKSLDTKGEQYRTFNLVNAPQTYRIKTIGVVSTKISTALNWAINNYNRLGLTINFRRVYNSEPADISVRMLNSTSAGGYSGFPSSSGSPYSLITVYSGTNSYSTDVVEHVLTHNIGHSLGMLHSDVCNPCGAGPVPVCFYIPIPGTPIEDASSAYNSCITGSEDGELSYYDQVALRFIY